MTKLTCVFETCPERFISRMGLLQHLFADHRLSGLVLDRNARTLTDGNGKVYHFQVVEEVSA